MHPLELSVRALSEVVRGIKTLVITAVMFEILPLDITVAAANYYNIIGKPAITEVIPIQIKKRSMSR